MALIEAFFTDTVTVTPYLRYEDGEDVFGEAYTVKCRLQKGRHQRAVSMGLSGSAEQIVAKATMYCLGERIPPRSRVTDGEDELTVADCYRVKGWGFHHWEVVLE